ncbi:MAG: haloacid dehalogenase [Candidatus Bathyarchaeia archaeon]
MSLQEIIAKAREELDAKSKLYDAAQSLGREAVRASKQATFRVHRRDSRGAESKLKEAEAAIREIARLAESQPELAYAGSFILACQEFAEARLLLALMRGEGLPTWGQIGVQTLPYVLGLADLVGELRRAAVDALREGRLDEAERRLSEMEEIYVELFTVESPAALSQGLRRKLDVARRLIETTRGEVALEARRQDLERSMNELRAQLVREPRRRKGGRAPKEAPGHAPSGEPAA